MSTLKVDSIKSADGNTDLLTLSNGSVSGVIGGRRNLIINGGFDVWQRGTSLSNVGGYQFLADRFKTYTNASCDWTRESCSLDEFKYSLKCSSDNDSNAFNIYHYVENTGQFYNGQTLTFSFWARASKSIDVRGMRLYANGTGATYVTDYDVLNVTTSWQKFTVTKTISNLPSDATYVRTYVASNSAGFNTGDWIETTGWQLEVGSVATPFEHRSYGEELALCQRYYERTNPTGNFGYYIGCSYNSVEAYFNAPYLVRKRAVPTVTFLQTLGDWIIYGNGAQKSKTAITFFPRLDCVVWYFDGSFTGGQVVMATYPGTEAIEFDAEL